jgi:hypothetical protein
MSRALLRTSAFSRSLMEHMMRARELHAAALDSDDDEVVRPLIELDDLVGHSTQRAIHGARIEDGGVAIGHAEAIWVAARES